MAHTSRDHFRYTDSDIMLSDADTNPSHEGDLVLTQGFYNDSMTDIVINVRGFNGSGSSVFTYRVIPSYPTHF